MRRCGSIHMLQVVLVFVIVIAASIMMGGSLGKKVTDGLREFDVPVPGSYCPGDAGEVPYDEFIRNLRMATKVAWNGKRACWVKQDLDTSTGDYITQEGIINNITYAVSGLIGAVGDDCYQGYLASNTNLHNSVDMVLWWDDVAVCSTGGFASGLIGWVQESMFSRDTLFFYQREDYCRGGNQIEWHNPPRRSNIAKYSESKGRFNDDNICVGEDLRLPVVEDLRETVDDFTAKNNMKFDMERCVKSYTDDFNGGDSRGIDMYLACEKTYIFKPKADADIIDIFPDDLFFYDTTIGYFGYYADACDILDDDDESKQDYNEFNSVTWNRDSDGDQCIYVIVDRFIKTETEIVNGDGDEENMLKKGVEYTITPFYYFEDGANDLVIVIDSEES